MNQSQAAIQGVPSVPVSPATHGQHDASLRIWLWPAVLLLVAAGWVVRNGHFYEAGDDVGYYMGLVGSVMLLTLLLYSLRKHIRLMHGWGATRHWFRLHMLFGIAGPALILFHSTFRLGSVNAAVALACMLLVAGSGIVGRFIYRKIHHGLYGRSATLQEMQTSLGIVGGEVKSRFHFAPQIETRLKAFEAASLGECSGFWQRFWRFVTVGLHAGWTYYRVTAELRRLGREHARRHGWDSRKLEKRLIAGNIAIQRYLDAVVDVARFTAYERLFSLWHVLHVPFVFMLIISGIAHVIAVHMY